MGDFSQPSDVCNRNCEVDLACALRGSISFGRFMSESLDWEKWSVFNHNKHLEEAKNCSVPGSVAQKKAFFEAHYRRSSSLKLAAELEPANDKTDIDSSCTKAENEVTKIDDSLSMKVEIEQKNPRRLKTSYKTGKNHGLEKMDGEKGSPTTGIGFHGKHCLQIKSSNRFQKNECDAIAYHRDNKKQDKRAIKEVSITSHQNDDQNKKKSVACIIKAVDIPEVSRISSSSASQIQKSISKENKPPQNRMEISLRSSDGRKVASGSPQMSISFNSIRKGQKPSLVNKISSFYEKVGDSKVVCTSSGPSELYHSHIKTPARVSTSGPKHTFSTPLLEYKRTPLYEKSSVRRKEDAMFCLLSINCFKSPSANESKQHFDRSVSSSSKTKERFPGSPNSVKK